MSKGTHDTLVHRLAQMLVKLNQGERLDPQALADEFGVNLRTIQRDLNERFAYLPLDKTGGRYHLDPTFLGHLSTRDVERFASLAGIRGLFPSLSDAFLRDIFDASMQSALLVKGHHYEALEGLEAQFTDLRRAIVERRHVGFDYRKDEAVRHHAPVAPHKLVNHKGIWYLAGKDGDRLKTFAFGRIRHLQVLDTRFEADPAVERTLQEDDGIWLGPERQRVVLEVGREVAGYFRRRKLIANQVIERECEGGGLIVSAVVGHASQVLPIVRYWIPHIRILGPDGLQAELEASLAAYLGGETRDSEGGET